MILRSTLQMKEIDAKIVSLRYLEQATARNITPEVNYKQFINHLQDKIRAVSNIAILDPAATANPNAMFRPGMHGFDPNSEMGRRLKQILTAINTFVTKAGISLANILAKQETPGGLVLYDSFVTALRQLFIPGVTEEDLRFVAENYLVAASSATPQGIPRSIDYRKFIDNLKLHTAAASKPLHALSKEQQDFYGNLSQNLQKKQITNKFTNAFLDVDQTLKGYLSEQQIV